MRAEVETDLRRDGGRDKQRQTKQARQTDTYSPEHEQTSSGNTPGGNHAHRARRHSWRLNFRAEASQLPAVLASHHAQGGARFGHRIRCADLNPHSITRERP